jgi:uncharacterized protein
MVEKDPFGDKMKLVERAKEDIYFAERDRELIDRLKQQLKKVEPTGKEMRCPKCGSALETYSFHGTILERCPKCHGIWLDNGELEMVVRKATRGPLGAWLDKLAGLESDKK